jgi:hypothetical protein
MILLGIIAGAAGGGGEDPVVGADLAHRYWRMLMVANSGDPFYSGAQVVQFYRWTNDDLDLLHNGNTVVTVQKQKTFYERDHISDDIDTTRWRGFVNPPANWIAVDFVVPVFIGSVAITAALTPNHDEAFSEFHLQFSDDGSAWTTAVTEAGGGNLTSGQRRVTENPSGDALTGVATGAMAAHVPLGRIANGTTVKQMFAHVILNRVVDAVGVYKMSTHIVLEP